MLSSPEKINADEEDKGSSERDLIILSREDFCKLCTRKKRLVTRFRTCKKDCNLGTCPKCISREADLIEERNLKKYCYGCLSPTKGKILSLLNIQY